FTIQIHMKFNGIFREYNTKIRYNREKMTSVQDFIEMIKPGENSGLIYENFIKTTDDPRIDDRVYVDVHTFKGDSCIVVDIAILVELLLTFTCERSIEFRKTDAVYFIRHLEEWYAKYGIVGELRDFHERVKQH
ncbi:MAG: hypothetical protein RL528_555, partial [Bacteroidota bacterium]